MHCLFKRHRYMNYENKAGVYARPESRDQFRSSHRRCFVKKGFLKKFANFTAKQLCWSLFLINLQAFRPNTPRTPILKDIWELQEFLVSSKKSLKIVINFFTMFFNVFLFEKQKNGHATSLGE